MASYHLISSHGYSNFKILYVNYMNPFVNPENVSRYTVIQLVHLMEPLLAYWVRNVFYF